MRATFFFGATLRFGAAMRAPMYTAGDVAAAERTETCEASGAWKPAASAARQASRMSFSIEKSFVEDRDLPTILASRALVKKSS